MQDGTEGVFPGAVAQDAFSCSVTVFGLNLYNKPWGIIGLRQVLLSLILKIPSVAQAYFKYVFPLPEGRCDIPGLIQHAGGHVPGRWLVKILGGLPSVIIRMIG